MRKAPRRGRGLALLVVADFRGQMRLNVEGGMRSSEVLKYRAGAFKFGTQKAEVGKHRGWEDKGAAFEECFT